MSSTPTKRRKSVPRPRRVFRSAVLLILGLAVAIALLATVGVVMQLLSPMTTDKTARTVLVTIPSGANTKKIGEILARKHLIRRPFGFVLAARLRGLSAKMRAGRYELSPAMPPRQMAALIALGQTANDVVTIPEGFTVALIAQRLGEKHLADAQRFLTLAQTQGRSFKEDGFQPPSDNLEGYLFPDTYRFPKGMTEREIIAEMLGEFQRKVLLPEGAEIQKQPGGLPAVITLASLVEREAEVQEDRPRIAAVLTNRLKRDMALDCDATIQYALPAHKTRLYYKDLRVDSPYNTYMHKGLPPTPIANPGLPSIEAVLHPAAVDYLYYVAGPDGRHHIFSRTLAEHDRAITRARAD